MGARLLTSQDDQVNNNATITLSGGTIETASGVSETFGDLNLTTVSFLTFGEGATGNMSSGTYTPSEWPTINNFASRRKLVFKSDLTTTINTPSFFAFNRGGIASYSRDQGRSTFTITATCGCFASVIIQSDL